ncbi:MAG TPA: antibiotic biosynthesis monooxygenase [Actinomycetes bacterium]|nr:antibiotic biosynthesis monooxygenase [Actinomycetes bacterium]
MNPTIATDEQAMIEIELVRPGSTAGSQAVLRALDRDTRSLAAEPGFVSGSLYLSDDETIVACLQWTDEKAAKAARAHDGQTEQLGEVDLAAYEVAYVRARDGERIEIDPDAEHATLIDVMRLDDPARQAETLEFNIANSQGFAGQPGFRSTSVLRSLDGSRIATYSQWERVEDWIAAVKARAGESLPALELAESVEDVNAALAEPGRQIGAVPEYHAYHVVSIAGPQTGGR